MAFGTYTCTPGPFGIDQIYRRNYRQVYGGKDYDFTVLTWEYGGVGDINNCLVNVTVDKDKISRERAGECPDGCV